MSSTPLRVRAATSPLDVAAAYSLIDAAARHMLVTFGLAHWLFPFKNEELVARLAASPTSVVLLAFADDCAAPVATLTLSAVALSPYYDTSSWAEPGAPAAYIANLAVAPSRAGCGVGTALLRVAADEARARFGARFLRLDAINEHPHLKAFYTRAGFVQRGTAVKFVIKNAFEGGADAADGPPGTAPYLASAAVCRPPDGPTFSVTCQAYECAV